MATAIWLSLTPTPPSEGFLAYASAGWSGENPGSVEVLESASATTFAAEAPESIEAPVGVRIRMYTYSVNYPFNECASYELSATQQVRADGPDLLPVPYLTLGFATEDNCSWSWASAR